MVCFSRGYHFHPRRNRNCENLEMPTLEMEYRKFYKEMRQKNKRNKFQRFFRRNCQTIALAVCGVDIAVSAIDVLYLFYTTAYISNFFQCTYNYKVLRDPQFFMVECLMRVLNHCFRGMLPFPFVFTFAAKFAKKDHYCHDGMVMMPQIDFYNLVANLIWLVVCISRVRAYLKKDIVTYEIIWALTAIKTAVEWFNPEQYRYEEGEYTYALFALKVLSSLYLSFCSYGDYHYIGRLKRLNVDLKEKSIGERVYRVYWNTLTDEEKDFRKTKKLIPKHIQSEIFKT